MKAILIKYGATPFLRIWQNSTGAIKSDEGRFVRFGLVGSADLIGILQGGRFLSIEVKTGRAKQTEQQKRFQTMIENMGGVYILARSVDDVEKELQPYLSE